MPTKRPVYLDRRLTVCALCYCLCFSEEEFHGELKRLNIPRGDWPRFIPGTHGNASTHLLDPATVGDRKRPPVAIVCIEGGRLNEYSGSQIAALLCHEAVHIWQAHARRIGAFNDHGDEEEAYAIQGLTQSLLEECARYLSMDVK